MNRRFKDIVIERGLLTREHLERAEKMRNYDGSFLRFAVRQGWCGDEAVGRLLAEVCAVPYVDLSNVAVPPELVNMVTQHVMTKHSVVPLRLEGTSLTLVMADPTNIFAVDDVKFLTGYDVAICTSGPVAIQNALQESDEPRAVYGSAWGLSLERHGNIGLEDWVLGRAFAFDLRRPALEFLLDGGAHNLGPATVSSSGWSAPPAREVLFTDRVLYGVRDRVHVGVLFAAAAGQRVQVEMRAGLSTLPALEVEVDGNGLGWLALPAPPAGSYLLTLGDATASFTVATYRLSTLQVRWLGQRKDGEALVVELRASMLGQPLEGTLAVALLDGATTPARRVYSAQVRADGEGRASVRLPEPTEGAASLEVQVEGRAELTASVPLPGAARAEQKPLELSCWEETWRTSTVAFEGSSPVRGLHVGRSPGGVSAPLRIVEVARGFARVELTRPVQGGRLVSIAAGRAPVQVPVSDGAQGLRFDVPVEGPWTLLLAGFVEQDAEHGIRCWEGRAAVLVPSWALELEAPARVRPADEVALTLRGRPGASAWVAVRDARLSARGPSEAAAVALRQGLEASLERFADGYLKATLSDFFPRQYRSRGICYDALDDDSYSGRSEEVEELLDGAPGRGSRAAPKQDAPSMSDEPPAVVLCQAITFDAEGVARASFRAPPLLGQLEVDVLGVVRGDWASARAAISVHQAVHGELLLPRYVFAGDRATGTLHVRSESEPVEVEVRRDGTPLLLHEGRRNATRLTVSAPGGEVRFDASPGDFEVTLRMRHGEARRVVGRVDQPGRATWRQCSVVAVPAGGRLEVEGARALARVLPGVGATALRMSRALQDYAFSCAEQTAAILLASVTELLLDTDRRRELARHVSGAVERLRSMALPSGFFRAYPNRDVSPWLSKAAAAHLLELESVEPRSSLEPVWPDLQRALGMARKGAQAHGLERAPAQPRTTREALACVSRNPERTRELAEQVRAGMGTWQGRVAVLRLGAAPVGGAPEAPRSAAEIRAETAYGAAVLLRAGPELLTDAAPLIRTVLGGLEESGRCFSTLDTVAALALLGALPQGGSATQVCRVDGQALGFAEALQRSARSHIEAVDGPLMVELERLREEDLNTSLRNDIPGTVRLERATAGRSGPMLPGERLELVVRLDAGYRAGDLLQVFLPPALAWLHGGVQAKGLVLDFEGQESLRVPLVVTSATVDAAGACVPQRWGVYLRNMYDEHRGSVFDALSLVVPPGGVHGGPGVLEQRVTGAAR